MLREKPFDNEAPMTNEPSVSTRLPPGAKKRTELLDVLGQVKARVMDKLGIVDFPMPQFILIGSQSVGKSRLVESFAGEQFNFCSGTLGSRRPTVLEFRNESTATETKWFYRNPNDGQWVQKSMQEVNAFVSKSHNDLGHDVTSDPIYIRIESTKCVDMTIVDLPGYRGYASDAAAKVLQDKIEALNKGFLMDYKNVVLCVEESGDSANCMSLARVKEFDPNFKRTVLVRTKLDKYYGDLTIDNVNKWLDGMGDLPSELQKFSLTLPHWPDGQPIPAGKNLSMLRDEFDQADLNKVASLGASTKYQGTVGFGNFARFMERKIESMFQQALGPVLGKLRDLQGSMESQKEALAEELESVDPQQMLSICRAVGASFANCLTHVMEGYVRSDINRTTLDDELRDFHKYQQNLGRGEEILQTPSQDFAGLEDYIEYLRTPPAGEGGGGGVGVPAFEVAINGGAQFRRLMFEVETFLRFSEIGIETKKRDVMQSFGIAMNSIGWREVIVKLLNHDAHLPLQSRITYVGERIKWFFLQQKDPIVQFMKSLKGSADEKLYSFNYTKHAVILENNQIVRKLVYDTYDAVVDRQLAQFIQLFKSTLHATFANPWVFLKKTTATLEGEMGEEIQLPALEDTKARIPQELQSRSGIERMVNKWIYDIPMEPHEVDTAVDKVQLLLLKVYSHIRSQVCDQVELFAESFFKLPLMRLLEQDMSKIELSAVDVQGYQFRRTKLERDLKTSEVAHKEVSECLAILDNFAMKQSRE